MSGLSFERVTVRFGATTAVDDVSLHVPSGSVVGLVGESGSGKSTLARAAVGLAPLHSGTIRLGDEDALARRGRRRPVQMVFQDPQAALDPRMSIGSSVSEGMIDVPRRGRRDETRRLLELVHLDPDLEARRPAGLSGGQRQRVSLARALAARPDVLIADEITSALDVSVQGAVLNVLRTLQQELGFTVLFISHNLAVVRYVSDSVAVLKDGHVVEFGPVEDVVCAPQQEYTRELLAAAPMLGESFFPSAGSRSVREHDA